MEPANDDIPQTTSDDTTTRPTALSAFLSALGRACRRITALALTGICLLIVFFGLCFVWLAGKVDPDGPESELVEDAFDTGEAVCRAIVYFTRSLIR